MNSKKPYLIAEISANHNGSFLTAKKLIKCAKVNGADAVKLQTYQADTMTLKSNKRYFQLKSGLWKNYTLWNLYNQAKTPLEWHKKLFDYAKKINIKIFSSPFDESAVEFLQKLNCSIYKIASFEMTDLPLIKKVVQTKKPIIISTGAASMKEITESYNYAKKCGARDITLMYCVSNYPSKNSDFNLNNIRILKKKFTCKVGFSDHSKDNRIAIAAVAAGAEVIEKHIALDGQKKGFDIDFSLKGKEIKQFRQDIDLACALFDKKNFFRNISEIRSRIHRRSIFISKDIIKGEKFSIHNIKRVRPGHGLEPKYYEKILNKKSPMNLFKGEPLKKNILIKLRIK
jgi:pseudaminic acid synthase|tara:strand:- start:1000 stop:2028 length:1029 start_codon:yes stop_codon:yes gene_type:complete